jgi:hypothetical protein
MIFCFESEVSNFPPKKKGEGDERSLVKKRRSR